MTILKSLRDPQHTFIIAEISGNHSGRRMKAARLIEQAAACGVDAVKFQTFDTDEIAAPGISIPTGHDQDHDDWLKFHEVKTLRQLFEKGGLPREWHKELQHVSYENGVEFISTPFSVEAAKFLVEDIGVRVLKIASGDLTYVPLLQYAAKTLCEIIISTGGAHMHEVMKAVTIDLEQRCNHSGPHGKFSVTDVNVLQCISSYPCPISVANVGVVGRYKKWLPLGIGIGYSDHTLSDLVPVLAVTQGATIIEKHFKMEGDESAIDVGHSLGPLAFKQMVEKIRDIPLAMGWQDIKEPVDLEYHDRIWARRDPSDWLRPDQPAREGNWK